jgi:hypothetical protein
MGKKPTSQKRNEKTKKNRSVVSLELLENFLFMCGHKALSMKKTPDLKKKNIFFFLCSQYSNNLQTELLRFEKGEIYA